MKIALVGIGAGLLGALALGQLISSLVFRVPLRDPATFAAVGGVMLAVVALAACGIPALRASRVDPIEALRHE